MGERKLLFLPIEIIERELEGKLLVAMEALSRGYSVMVGQYYRLPRVALRAGFGFYLHKAHTDYRAKKLFIPLHEKGMQCGALDEEGLVFPDFESYARIRVGEGLAFRYLDSIMTWGDAQKEFLSTKHPDFAGKMVSVGNPRIDLLRRPYRERLRRRIEEIRRSRGDFVLVNTNFGPGNYGTGHKMGFAEHMKFFGYDTTPEQEQFTQRRIRYYEGLFTSYVAMVKELAAAIAPVSVIVRPHPAEDHDRWREELGATPNVKVVFEGGVNNWLAAARCVIHTGCTTGIEAYFLETPVLRYNPRYDASIEAELPNSLSEGYADAGALVEAVKKTLAGEERSSDNEARRRYVSEWIASADGPFAHERIMDAIDSVYRADNVGAADFWRCVRPPAIRRMASFLKHHAKRLWRSRGKGAPKMPFGYSGEKISGIIREYMMLRDPSRPARFSTRRITKDVLLITPRGDGR